MSDATKTSWKLAPAVLTANELMRGDAVWRDASGGWTLDIAQARLFDDEATAQSALADAQAEPDRIVGAYLAKARRDDEGRAQPEHYREVIRSKGPSFRTDLGKQAAVGE